MGKSKEAWEEYLLKELTGTGFGCANIIADGYSIYYKEGIYKKRIIISWYLDQKWKGEYANPTSKIGAKFGTPMYLKASRKELEIERLLNGAKAAKALKNKKHLYAFSPSFPSANAIIRLLKITCTQITIDEPQS